MQWFLTLQPEIQGALIGAVVSLTILFLKDFVLKLWQERKQSEKTALDIYKKYTDPLALASSDLLWRLREIFYDKASGSYLSAQEPLTRYEGYKQRSTLYRLGALLGWVRAYRRELSFLTFDNNRKPLQSLQESIYAFEGALADGTHIELQRLEGLCKVWDIEIPSDSKQKSLTGLELDYFIKRFLRKNAVNIAIELSEKQQIELCSECCKLICQNFSIKSLSSDLIVECRVRAIQQIAVREAWLFRDWQAGIGDLMLHNINGGERRFEVVGYKDFEQIFLDGNKEEKRWFDRLASVLIDLDVSGVDRFDARVQQLRATMVATAKIVLALSEMRKANSGISIKTISLAREIIAGSLLI